MMHSRNPALDFDLSILTDAPWPTIRSKRNRPSSNGIIFGYLFRLLAAIVVVIINVFILLILGSISEWIFTSTMLGFQIMFIGISVLLTEHFRSRVYERVFSDDRNEKSPPLTASDVLDDSFVLRLQPKDHPMFRRLLDITFSGISMILLLPHFLILIVLIKMDSVGPIFFKSRRIGKKGKEFYLILFRTLSPLTFGTDHPAEVDIQVTRAGSFLRKTALDRLPTLWNVFIGDLSIVGPRPLNSYQLNTLSEEYKLAYSQNSPGMVSIGGLLNISRTRELQLADLLKIDIGYHTNSSMWSDTKLVFKSMIYLLTGSAAV